MTPMPTSDPMARVIHQVFFWLKRPGDPNDRSKLIEGLNSLRAIPEILTLHIGVPAGTEQRTVVDASFDVSEIMFFNDVAGQKIYQDHPVHKQFVDAYGHLWDHVLVYDSLVPGKATP